jgi:hypothetical protein
VHTREARVRSEPHAQGHGPGGVLSAEAAGASMLGRLIGGASERASTRSDG